jgi:DNA-binding NarL/FixJ family response regulator
VNQRSRVLIADDHSSVLKKVSSLLDPHFDIVAAVESGQAALDAAAKFQPDVAILDISMPELDGIQTANALRRLGYRAKVVFLTMHRDDDYISAALATGALGYVVKSHMHRELMQAVNLALSGYRFVSPFGFTTGVNAHGEMLAAWLQHKSAGHALQFHSSEETLLAQWAEFLGNALREGVGAIATTTQTRGAKLGQLLENSGVDLLAAMRNRRYLLLDVDLLTAIVDAQSGPSGLISLLDDAVEQVLPNARTESPRLVIAGEIAPALWRHGKPHAALRVEQLTNDWARTRSFSVFCSYPTECFSRKSDREFAFGLCAEHTAIIPQPA